jgi:hypothetical protein
MDDFKLGTLEWNDNDLDRLVDPNADLGGDFMLTNYQEHEGSYAVEFKTPKWASTTPLELRCFFEGEGISEEPCISVELAFLGSGVFKMAFRGKDLLKKYKGNDDIVFVGIHTKKEEQLAREREAFSEEWRNDRYTGYLHPSNWNFRF